MLYTASTLRHLRDAVDALIEACGGDADTPIGTGYEAGGDPQARHLDREIMLNLIYIDDATGRIVGDEANDYRPGLGERAAIEVR